MAHRMHNVRGGWSAPSRTAGRWRRGTHPYAGRTHAPEGAGPRAKMRPRRPWPGQRQRAEVETAGSGWLGVLASPLLP